jgi:general secretion pathway protein M
MTAPSAGKDHCGLALGLLVAVVLLLNLLITWPWLAKNREYDESIERSGDQIRRYQSMQAQRPELEAQLKGLNQEVQNASYYIDAGTPALAAAALQRRVKQVVDGVGGKLTSTQNLPPQQDGNAQRVSIRVRMSGDVGVLMRVLHALEGEPPLLFVDNLSIRNKRTRRRVRRRRTPVQPEKSYSLDISFELMGYVREYQG